MISLPKFLYISRIMKGIKTVIGVFITDSNSRTCKTLFAEPLNIIRTAPGSVPDIIAAKTRAYQIRFISLKRSNAKKLSATKFTIKKTKLRFKIGKEYALSIDNLNFDDESKTIMTRARVEMLVM